MSDLRYRSCKHDTSLRCLQTCTEWKLEVVQAMEGQPQHRVLGEFFEPTISYKHCSEVDKSDLIDILISRNSNRGFSLRGGGAGPLGTTGQPIFKINPTSDVSDSVDRHFLEQCHVTYPFKNKTKAQNSIITNFQFEQCLKEETFTLTFDVQALRLKVNSALTSSEFVFNINGMCHDQPVFSDGIFYMFKGGKMLNCALS